MRDDDSPRGWISRYAWGDDYHDVLRERLNALVARMHAQWPEPFEARAYVDTGPVVERVAAKYAGLGWLAKNTCLINEQARFVAVSRRHSDDTGAGAVARHG